MRKAGRNRWRRALAQAALAILSTRLVLLAAGIAALHSQAFDFVPDSSNVFLEGSAMPATLDVWARWDARWYLEIAARGYAARLPVGTYDMRPNFFPAFPIAIRLLMPVFGNPVLAGIVISNAAFLAALALLHVWTGLRVSRAAADRLVWVYATFPTSFFFSAVYAESLLLVALAAAWWAAEQQRWTTAGLCLAIAVLSRPIGIFSLLALGCKGVCDVWGARTSALRMVPVVLLPLVAAAGYLFFAHLVLGDALATIRTQEATRGPMGWPWEPFVSAWRDGLYWNGYTNSLIDGLLAIGAVLSLPFVFLRMGSIEGLLASAVVLFPLTSGFISFSRLVLPAFPVFVLVAAGSRGWRFPALTGAAFALQTLLFVWFACLGWVA
jgi:hypothetical protein